MINFAQNKLEVGSKNKLKRFKENETFTNVFQPTREEVVGDQFPLKGKWSSDFFKNDNPIVLELGCGKGEYSVGLAERFPEKNFIGIDIKGARFWRGAKTAVESGMNNVAFVRTQIELINHIFAENEVSEIWITFPDPQIKYKRTKHRMTNSEFLKLYKRILKPGGTLIVAVPNCSSHDADHYNEHWAALDLPIHLYHFQPKNIEQLFSNHQMKLVEILPMKYDAYYISMISERYKGGNIISGFWRGFISNRKAKKQKKKEKEHNTSDSQVVSYPSTKKA